MDSSSDFMNGVRVRFSKRARRMALRLDTAERVVHLVVPNRASLSEAYRFAREHKDWIRRHLSQLPAPVGFRHDTVLPLLGRDVRIDITCDPQVKTTRIMLKDDILHVITNRDDPAARIQRFLIRVARENLSDLAREKALRAGRMFKSLQVRDTTSRWGSCGEDGRMSFSWRLIFAPPAAMDYVVAHEIAHLIHMNHSRAFWSLCRSLSADYFEGHHWMQAHGSELMRYG